MSESLIEEKTIYIIIIYTLYIYIIPRWNEKENGAETEQKTTPKRTGYLIKTPYDSHPSLLLVPRRSATHAVRAFG